MQNADAIMQAIQGFLSKDQIAIPREMLTRSVVNWMASQGFDQFEKQFPEQAAFLRDLAKRHDVISRGAMLAVGTLLSATVLKKRSTVAKAAVANALITIQNKLLEVDHPISKKKYAELGKKVFQMEGEAMLKFVEWSNKLDEPQRAMVYSSLVNKSPEEIQGLMALDEQQRMEILVFLKSLEDYQPVRSAGKPETAAETPFLKSLRFIKGKLQEKKLKLQQEAT